jgi:peptidoglycan/LPS O-acetylase OafA/YrhL
MAQRELYVDRLRVVLTALVLFHHTAITYGSHGYWLYYELLPSAALSSFLLTLFVSTNQAWFMGCFFLLAGYFTPPSLDRKGYARFIGDRLKRLGIPLLAYSLILGPCTASLVAAAQGKGFWSTLFGLWRRGEFSPGPLWFAELLLIFSLCFVLWRRIQGPQPADARALVRIPTPLPGWRAWMLSAVIVGAAAFAIRLEFPIGYNIYGFFASYILLFALGTRAWRRNWFSQLAWKQARPALIVACVVWPILPLAWKLAGGGGSYIGGLSWKAALYAFWEPFVAWGLIAACLLLFREHMNRPSRFWDWLSRRAYAVYIIHPPVLVGIALLLHGWVAPALVKFAVVGLLACVATWLLADPLVRLPEVRRVV